MPTQTNVHRPFLPATAFGFALSILALFTASVAGAAAAGAGAITGKIFKPGTGEFVRGAEVRVQGTDRVTVSEGEGYYYLSGVPAGPVTLEVSFTGAATATAAVVVPSGGTATLNVDLVSDRGDADVTRLGAFVVTSEVEGNAKAIQEQKNAMGISNHVSSDAFQEQAGGNVGEYMKWLAGVDLDYVQFDARGPRLRGMDAQYTSVTIDGLTMASADAFTITSGTENSGTEGTRAFGFESISLSSVEAIEVYKSLSADQSANSPAGTINLRSKRAFDRKGRHFVFQYTVNANSESFYLRKRPGPGDNLRNHLRPGGTFEYSDVFLKNRLGIVLNFNQSGAYNRQDSWQLSTVNRTPSAADPRPGIPILFGLLESPVISNKRTGTFTVDYKVTPELAVGVTAIRSSYVLYFDNRQLRFMLADNTPAGRSSVVGDDPMVSFVTGATGNSTVNQIGTSAVKLTDSHALSTRIDWRPLPSLALESRIGWSKSDNDYESFARSVAAGTAVNAISAKFRGQRSSVNSSDWVLTQTGGPDWTDLANYSRPRVSDDARRDLAENWTFQLDAKYTLPIKLPSYIKIGGKRTEDSRKFTDQRNWYSYEYIGPGGVTRTSTAPGTAGTGGSFAGYETRNPVDLSSVGFYGNSLSGGPVTYPGRDILGHLVKDHPEYFSQSFAITAANYYSSFIGNDKLLREDIDAGYGLGYARWQNLEVQGGLRYERTTDTTEEFVQRPNAEVTRAGFAIGANGQATTIPGLQYQFQSLPKRKRQGQYDNVFPTAALKYKLTPDLHAQVTFNKAIARPPTGQLSGIPTVNETSRIITAPNPGLLPEHSKNYSARLAYYMKRGGILAVGVFENQISNLRMSYDYTGADAIAALGFDSDEYEGYLVRSTINGTGERQFRGMEVEYRQSFYFLPKPFDGANAFVNYTRNYASVRRGGLSPHQISTGLSYTYKKAYVSMSSIWTPDVPFSQNLTTRYRKERTMTDASASYRFNRWLTLSVSVRNLFETPHEMLHKEEGQRTELMQRDVYGSLYTFSAKATF